MHWHRRTPFVLTAAGLLCTSIPAAALTTSDPRWWLSCFSRLGATDDASSVLFNGGVVLAGAVIALSAVSVSIGLRGASPAGFRAGRSAAGSVPLLIATLGISLVLVGLLPLSFNVFAHERAANGALASSAALLLVHRLFLRGLSRMLNRIANAAVVVLVLGMAGLVTGLAHAHGLRGIRLRVDHHVAACAREDGEAVHAGPYDIILSKLSAIVFVPHLGDKAIRCYCLEVSWGRRSGSGELDRT